MSLKKFNLINDIYYSKEYISLYLKEDEEIFEYKYEEDDKFFFNISIKRPIKEIGALKCEELYYDLETAYGYGGFYANSEDNQFLNQALDNYEKYCKSQNIIAEFSRYHVFNNFAKDNSNYFNMNIYDRDVVYVDLTISKEERWASYNTKMRNILRKCEKENLEFVKSSNIDSFMALYEQTMDKNNADGFFYFPKEYFVKLLENDDVELYEVKKDGIVLSSSFFMFSDVFGHYHLSANNYEMRNYNGNYFILDRAFDIAKEKGLKYFVLGGGTTSSEDDTLFKFKKKFSKELKPFHICGKIYNKGIYDKYIQSWEEQSAEDIKYFLKYRLEIK